jgi:glycosyltransferase involved in cell wall biosynthesis
MSSHQDIVVSVIVPCYNQAQYLDDALESVLNQNFTSWECIVVDDSSPDDTKAVAQHWIEKDNRFSYVKQENKGLSAARNFGISHAKGTFILPLDADDKISSNYLQLAVKAFSKNEALKVVYSKAEKFGVESGFWNLNVYSPSNLAKANMIFCSAVFKKADWERIGGYDEHMKGGLEDWEFWIHLLKTGGEVLQLDTICFYYRIKENSMIKDVETDTKKRLYEYVSVKHADFFVAQLGSFYQYMHEGIKENNELKKKINSKKHALTVLFKPLSKLFAKNK